MSGRMSLRDIESNMKAQQRKLYHLGAKTIPKLSLAWISE
ncbi:DUF4372 domain-containing protein [Pseudomonadota bacterium]